MAMTSLSASFLSDSDLPNGSFDRWRVRANDSVDLLSILEDQDGGHGSDAELLGNVRDFIDVDFVEAGVFVFFGETGGEGR